MDIRVEDLSQMDFSDVAEGGKLPPVMPGEILLEDFLKPMGLTQYRLAKEIGVPQRRIGEIIAGKRAITVNTGLRLARFFGMNKWVLDWSANRLRYSHGQKCPGGCACAHSSFPAGSGNPQIASAAARRRP